MAPPPEYDKEPKAPDKSVTNNITEDSKIVYVKDQQVNSEYKTTTTVVNDDVENNKHVETLDDGQLRALLDEAITYKCPKDREGKSSLFKELLEEVEQDEQACEAAARGLGAGKNARRGRARREHHSSLQDLVAAMAGETAPRRGRAHGHSHAPAPPASTVSARALHGGSLPSGVDTSFLLGEDSGVGVANTSRGGYLATVRCVNPPPLAERRVSTGDANPSQPQPTQPSQELDVLTRRSKPMFPMTYTARATLEIGSGSVCSGRAVTTTTASNQVRTTPRIPAKTRESRRNLPAHVPAKTNFTLEISQQDVISKQAKLMNALRDQRKSTGPGGGRTGEHQAQSPFRCKSVKSLPRGPTSTNEKLIGTYNSSKPEEIHSESTSARVDIVNNWYDSLNRYSRASSTTNQNCYTNEYDTTDYLNKNVALQSTKIDIFDNNIATSNYNICNIACTGRKNMLVRNIEYSKNKKKRDEKLFLRDLPMSKVDCDSSSKEHVSDANVSDISLRKKYRERVGNDLIAPREVEINPRNFRSLTIGKLCTVPNVKDQITKPIKHLIPHSNCKNVTEHKDISRGNFEKAEKIHNQEPSVVASEINEDRLVENFKRNDSNIKNKRKSIDLPETSNKATTLELVNFPRNYNKSVKSGSVVHNVGHHKKLINIVEINNNEYSRHNFMDVTKNKTGQYPERGHFMYENSNIKVKKLLKNIKEIATRSEKDAGCFPSNRYLSELPNNAYTLLSFPENFYTNYYDSNNTSRDVNVIISNNCNTANTASNEKKSHKKNTKKSKQRLASFSTKKEIITRNTLKMLLYSDNPEKINCVKQKLSTCEDKEVDSAIPFSCITTPEVVASCNTTSSSSQSTVAVDPKPLQLVSSYRAVACLMESACQTRLVETPRAHSPPAHPAVQQPRGVISSSFNGLPLSRPAASDEYKKSLDENGNALQGFGSPISGSGQHKKPRRKKSSKNETVIKSHQIDGYQGNKDLNEVLRFIESNAEGVRAPKLRSKHKDDTEDKGGKKRSTERRKDKENKVKRATSLEELSRTTLEDLTDKPRDAPSKPERRSWGDDARALLARPPAPDPDPPAELADFQTVTKKRKPRRRADDSERAPSPPRRTRAPSPSPRTRVSAPASDRSNDSNDDTDCAHSPPPAPSAPPSHASYADIARTRHNIPDLIESCNFYAEGEEQPPPVLEAPPDDAEQYPALATRRARDKPPAPTPRATRKEPPAPDVVADRRPPVVLLAAGARSRDMDGVTFGFDINEQLLGARCDLLEHGAVAVRAGCVALRYVPPDPPLRSAQLHQIVDYVGAAWEDVMRGGSKVRYFSECLARNE